MKRLFLILFLAGCQRADPGSCDMDVTPDAVINAVMARRCGQDFMREHKEYDAPEVLIQTAERCARLHPSCDAAADLGAAQEYIWQVKMKALPEVTK